VETQKCILRAHKTHIYKFPFCDAEVGVLFDLSAKRIMGLLLYEDKINSEGCVM
jgi:hypothetical protein